MSFSIEHIDICKKGNLEDIIFLMNEGYDKNNILIWLSRFGHLEIVKYLVEKCGADVRSNNDYAVRRASMYGHLEVVKYLIEDGGANARAEDDCAARCASQHGHLKVVKYLVGKCGADVRVNSNFTVWLASVRYHFEMIKYLVEKCRVVVFSGFNPKYERYLSVCEKGEKKRKCIMAKKIYFWWVQICYNPNTLCGQRSMYKGYREYLSIR